MLSILKLIFIESYGMGELFSSRGLDIAIQYFQNRGHVDIKCVVRREQLFATTSKYKTQSRDILQRLMNNGLILPVENDIYDDKIILQQAVQKFAVIISNDKFRDDQFKNSPEISKYLKEPK